ncbi:hypothetical protein ACLMJK_004769 [Lecanora helva]
MESKLTKLTDDMKLSLQSGILTPKSTSEEVKKSLGDTTNKAKVLAETTSPSVHRSCFACGRIEQSEALQTCARCLTARYCSRECQRKHWKTHKKTCHKPKNPQISVSQASPLGMDGAWNGKVYKPTTPKSLFVEGIVDMTPEKVEEVPEDLRLLTQYIYKNVEEPGYRITRAIVLLCLGFADLAVGDAFKAYGILQRRLCPLVQGHQRNWEDLSGYPLEQREFATKTTSLLTCAYSELFKSLVDSRDHISARAVIKEGRKRFPSDDALEKHEKYIDEWMKQSEEIKRLRAKELGPYFSDDIRFGCIHYLPYPFMPKEYLTRSDTLIRSIRNQLEKESEALMIRSVTLSSSRVQDRANTDNPGATPALGIFAACDISNGMPLFIDTPALAATELETLRSTRIDVCDNCCGIIPSQSSQKCLAPCCKVKVCLAA